MARAQAGHWISFSAISADGSKVYFSDIPEPSLINGQIRVTDLATGRSRVVYAPAGAPGLIASDPGVRHLLLQVGEQPPQPGRLVRLDLATGKTTDLPSRRFDLPAVLYW